jgi:hypothetical protein
LLLNLVAGVANVAAVGPGGGPDTVAAGAFNLQFWGMGDNGGSGANTLFNDTVIPDANLGTFSATEQQAITRAFEYWSDQLNLPAAGANSPVIRIVLDVADPSFNANAFSVGNFPGGGTDAESNVISRLINAGNPTRVDDIDGRLVFIPAGETYNTYKTDKITQLSDRTSLEAIAVHEVGHLLGIANSVGIFDAGGSHIDSDFNAPFSDNVVDPSMLFSDFNGTNAVNVFGGIVPLGRFNSHLVVDFHNMTRATVFGVDFRNMPAFGPVEFAVLKDVGYNITLSDHFGQAFYQDGTDVQEALGPFSPGKDYAIGVFLMADNRNLLINGDINTNGLAVVKRTDRP